METTFAKVSGNRSHVVVDLKRKRAKSGENVLDASGLLSPLKSTLIHNLGKRRKVDSGCNFLPSRSLDNYHSNFMKCGIPRQLMYYQHGEWVNFPEDTLGLVKENFQAKKGTVEVKLNNEWFALDFLHMIRLDLKTGFQQPIAWIDDAGRCYFPETFSDSAEFHSCGYDEDCHDQLSENQGSGDIVLQLQIEINGSNISKLTECSGEFNPLTEGTQTAGRKHDGKKDDGCFKGAGVKLDGDRVETESTFESGIAHLDSDTVREIFFQGIHLRDSANIISISRGLSSLMEARYELFLKQVEIIQRYHGNANVQYAWLPTSAESSSSIMKHGLCFSLQSNIKPDYGYGVYLIPAKCTEISAKHCDVDENGVRHMILCRVIMGNTELVCPGSKQFHPSSEEFDSGIDDLQNPKHYIIWNMHANTHIYPEYVVSFKISSDAKGLPVNENVNLHVTGACRKLPEVQVQFDSPASDLTSESHQASAERRQEKVANVTSSSMRAPKSPWIPFPMLLTAISNKVPEKVMDAVNKKYELYKGEKMNRDDFVRNLRIIVGDALLRETVTSFQQKVPTKAEIEALEQHREGLKRQ